MSAAPTQRIAMVLSGGSVYAAYEVGVMEALFAGESPATDYQPIEPTIYTGTSAGSINAALMVSQSDVDTLDGLHYLKHVWLDLMAADASQCREGAIRVRGDPTKYFSPDCLRSNPAQPLAWFGEDVSFLAQQFFTRAADFLSPSSQPLSRRFLELVDIAALISKQGFERNIRQTVNLEGIRQSEKALCVAATNWRTGELRLFQNEDMTDANGHLILFASSAFPGIPPVIIDGEPYVDGGYVMNTPLHPAWDAGADILHVVYLDPDVKNIPLRELYNTFDVIDKLYHIMMASIFERDVQLYADINQGLDVISRQAEGTTLNDPQLRGILRLAGRIKERADYPAPYRVMTIHRYHPEDDLGGVLGLMNFDRSQIQKLIQNGYEDAVNHDCQRSGCVLPP